MTSMTRLWMPTILATALVAACGAASDGEGELTDTQWDQLVAEDTGPAVLEDASEADDGVEAPPELDAEDDATEVDDVDDDAESDAVAAAPDDGAADLTPRGAGDRRTFTNPVLGNCADPGVIHLGGASPTFVVACTGGGYPMFQSNDLVGWKADGRMFSNAVRPKWVGKNWWAPEIHHIGGTLVAYFSAFSTKRNKMCIGAARATSIAGPWKDIGGPLVCDKNVGLIDAHATTTADGRHFLYYKTEGNALRPQKKTIIYGHQLGADGVSFVGKRRKLLENTLAWEGDVVEGPWVRARGKYFYLFYSGFRYCNATYGVGVARARSPLGPFRKKGAPILHSNGKWSGPGHNSVVSVNGHDWIVYHAWRGAHACGQDGNRALLIDRIQWEKGWPRINNGTPSRLAHPAP